MPLCTDACRSTGRMVELESAIEWRLEYRDVRIAGTHRTPHWQIDAGGVRKSDPHPVHRMRPIRRQEKSLATGYDVVHAGSNSVEGKRPGILHLP